MLFFIVARIYGVFFESGVASKLSIKTKTFPVIKPKSISVKKETAVSGLRYFISLERWILGQIFLARCGIVSHMGFGKKVFSPFVCLLNRSYLTWTSLNLLISEVTLLTVISRCFVFCNKLQFSSVTPALFVCQLCIFFRTSISVDVFSDLIDFYLVAITTSIFIMINKLWGRVKGWEWWSVTTIVKEVAKITVIMIDTVRIFVR